jgi:hypothetical protein
LGWIGQGADEYSIAPSERSTTNRSTGCLTQATTSCRSKAASNPAMTPPMLPRPMTATLFLCEFLVRDDIKLQTFQNLL